MTKKEMERLATGDIIQSKEDKKWAFIVSANFPGRLTAVRTIEIREEDAGKWEIVKKPQTSE